MLLKLTAILVINYNCQQVHQILESNHHKNNCKSIDPLRHSSKDNFFPIFAVPVHDSKIKRNQILLNGPSIYKVLLDESI
jgi:hypothetical protein